MVTRRPARAARSLLAVACLCLVALGLGSLPPSGALAEPGAQEGGQAGPVRARVGVYLLRIAALDIGAGSYAMDFYLTFSCDRPCDPDGFEFLNGRAASISKQDDLPQYKVYRVVAELTANFNLRSFPFDSHRLSLVLEDELKPTSELVYEVDEQRTDVAPDLIVAGWDVDRGWKASVRDQTYPLFEEPYSRYAFSVRLSRPFEYSIVKNLLPAIIIVVTGLLALFISSRFMLERLTISSAALVGAILYHLEVTQNIPPLPYLTFEDRFMLIIYVALALTLGSTVALMVLEQGNRERAEQRLRALSLRIVPAVWLLLNAVNLLTL